MLRIQIICLQFEKEFFTTVWYIVEPSLLRSKVKNVEIGCSSVGLTLTLHLIFTKSENDEDLWFVDILQAE